MAFSDSVKDFIMACEYANFVNVTDPDDIEDLEGYELNKGDFVYFLGIFCFNSERKLLIKCPDNNRFKIKISYELDGSFDRFETSVEYYSYFKGIWGSSQVDLIDVESSLEIASPLNDFSSNKQDSNIQVDNTKDNECKDSVPAIEESSTNTQSTGEDLKSVMDRLLEQQYLNTELARENEDLSKKYRGSKNKTEELSKQVEILTAQVRTLTGDKVSLSTELSELKSRLDEARVLTETNISLHRKVEDLTRENEGVVKELNFYKVKLDKAIAKCNGSTDKYNDLAKVYNKLREDYITLQGDYKILREPSTKSRVLKIIRVLLLSPLVFMLEFVIFILLFAL